MWKWREKDIQYLSDLRSSLNAPECLDLPTELDPQPTLLRDDHLNETIL